MIAISDLLTYVPTSHGEHGVDATLHALCIGGGPLHIVFANPPGGSWTQFDLLRPETNSLYRWDHIPRAPSASVKRPDLVLQANQAKRIDLLSLESKLSVWAIEEELGGRLTRYFTGIGEFKGIKQRPAWHSIRTSETSPEVTEGVTPTSNEWNVLPPDAAIQERFWFRDYPQDLIRFWSGFAYALTPEIYVDYRQVDTRGLAQQHKELFQTHKDLDLIVAIGWVGSSRDPFLISSYSESFAATEMAKGLTQHLSPAIFSTESTS